MSDIFKIDALDALDAVFEIISERDSDLYGGTSECSYNEYCVLGNIIRAALQAATSVEGEFFQKRVHDWMLACFGEEITKDSMERNHRFLEEALELVQSTGCTQSEAHQLVDYVFSRSVGEKKQECGGVMVTLAALCIAHEIDMNECGETELARVWTRVEKIRAKQAAKPKHSPLPTQQRPSTQSTKH